jgi:glycosyltransferase involved in cell wall biosynthesis
MLTEGKDFQFTPGGVARMVLPLLKQMLAMHIIGDAQWVSLNPAGPEKVVVDGVTLHHVSMQAEKLKGYGYTKEAIWKTFHGIPEGELLASEILWQDEFLDYNYYNRLSAEKILQLDKLNDFDIFYIHDFQQLPVGQMLHTLKPKIFRWHIPFDQYTVPAEWKEFLSTYLNSYDVVIVSCKKYLEALKLFGYTGKARYVYPYIDPKLYTRPSETSVSEFCQRFGIHPSDKVVLVVARFDPMKGQNKAIEAISKVVEDIPNVKLVLVGNGSFSSSKRGVGLSKAGRWLAELRALVKELRLEDHVVFAGHLSQDELNSAYERCDVSVLPSVKEGFGLVVIESWLFSKPTVVTSRAGISELIKDGQNGLLFDTDDPISLAGKISNVLLDEKLARTLGRNGLETSKSCLIDQGVSAESEVILRIT